MNRAVIEILDPGASTTIQDAGRHGYQQWGVTVSGAMDRRSMRRANLQLGNAEHSPVLESLFGGLAFRLDDDRWCALSGALAEVAVEGVRVPDPLLFRVRAGQRVSIAHPRHGLYTYVAVSGGLEPDLVLGSASTDSLSGIGPARLAPGDRVALGPHGSPSWSTDDPSPAIPRGSVDVSFLWGPREGLFPESDRSLFTETDWTVGVQTNRVGTRLEGATLSAGSGSLPSEGVVRGSIQIPPSGQPIVFLADHPITGGYPVIGVLREADQDLLAQAAPGTKVRFRPTPLHSTSTTPHLSLKE